MNCANILVKGLGKVLQRVSEFADRDSHRGWRWHAMNILVFCRIHFTRTVHKLIPESSEPNELTREARDRLLALLDCQSHDDYMRLLDLIVGKFPNLNSTSKRAILTSKIAWNPDLSGWASHKRIDVIAAGLCKACSPSDLKFTDEGRQHTNAVEQSHYKSYHMGVQDSLLQAVIK